MHLLRNAHLLISTGRTVSLVDGFAKKKAPWSAVQGALFSYQRGTFTASGPCGSRRPGGRRARRRCRAGGTAPSSPRPDPPRRRRRPAPRHSRSARTPRSLMPWSPLLTAGRCTGRPRPVSPAPPSPPAPPGPPAARTSTCRSRR